MTPFRAQFVYWPVLIACAFAAFGAGIECLVRWRWRLHLGSRILLEVAAGGLVLWNMETDGVPWRIHYSPYEHVVIVNKTVLELDILIGLSSLLLLTISCEYFIRRQKFQAT